MSKHQQIEELYQKLSALRQEKDKYTAEAEAHAEKRNRLNERFKGIREEISELKNKRDGANEKVKTLKQRRNELKAEIHKKIEQLKKLREMARSVAERKPQRRFGDLQKEFDEMEWKIQTTSLTLQEEKELIEQVKLVERQLNVYRKLEQANQQILENQAAIRVLKTEGQTYHGRLTEIAKNSQEIHQKMLTKIEESKKVKTEADSVHQAFLQTKKKAEPISDAIADVSVQIKRLKDETRQQEDREKKQAEDTLKEKLQKQAREKLERGEKLSWEEFQLITEDETGAQD